MEGIFDLGSGSIPGKDHLFNGNLLVGKNNQDAVSIYQSTGLAVAVVADGCGSKPSSEVGSQLGARLMATALSKQCMRHSALIKSSGLTDALTLVLEAARQDVLSHLRILAQAMTQDSFSQTVSNYFLFTMVGTIICPQGSAFFAIGDGVIVVNGEVLKLGPFEGNEPPYLSYALLNTRWKEDELKFKVHRTLPTDQLVSFLIGSDGVADLADKENATIPGFPDQVIGPLADWWTQDQYFTKTGIRRRLALTQSRHCSIKGGELIVDNSRLPDDTTLVVGRRKPGTAMGIPAVPVESASGSSDGSANGSSQGS